MGEGSDPLCPGEGLLEEIDAVADNRSRFLAEAARAELARRRVG